jgi:phage FluMu protein Com
MKNFFEKLGYKFQRFMYGRYGNDRLNFGLIWIYFIILILGLFLGKLVNYKIYSALWIVAMAVLIFALYRTLSKNVEKRRSENERWIKLENKIRAPFKLLGNKYKFRKTHVFKKCPNCKKVLRLKRKKGKHTVACPHCKTSFEITIRRDYNG